MVHSCAGLLWVYQIYLNHLKPIGHLRLCGRQTTCKDIMTWPKRWPSRVLSIDLDFLSLSSPCTRQIVAFQGWLLVEKTHVRDWTSLEKGAQKALEKLELQEDKTKIGHIMTLLQTICPCWDRFFTKLTLCNFPAILPRHTFLLPTFLIFFLLGLPGSLTWQGVWNGRTQRRSPKWRPVETSKNRPFLPLPSTLIQNFAWVFCWAATMREQACKVTIRHQVLRAGLLPWLKLRDFLHWFLSWAVCPTAYGIEWCS